MGISLPLLDSPRPAAAPKPAWLKVRAPGGPNYIRLKGLMRQWNLHSVCEEAHCPNIGECWEDSTATFMILGDICTRNCGYCAVAHGKPAWEDREEPERVGNAVRELGLEHVVITSVNRDDLADGGARVFAATVLTIRREAPACRVELLIPDFQGQAEALQTVIDAGPDILNHNTETVPRLYKLARHGGRYERTLGLGEEREELLETMRDLRAAAVNILTLGQYLRPSAHHLPVARYYTPDEFAELGEAGRALGFAHVESGPLVRSSYHAKRHVPLNRTMNVVGGSGGGAAPLPPRTDVECIEPPTTPSNRWGGLGEERRSLPPRTDVECVEPPTMPSHRWVGVGEERRSLPPRT